MMTMMKRIPFALGLLVLAITATTLKCTSSTPPIKKGDKVTIMRNATTPSAATTSPSGSTTLVGGAALTDNLLNSWKLAPDRRVMRNGVPVDQWSYADLLLWHTDKKIYATTQNDGRWYVAKASGDGFDRAAGDPRVASALTPTPTPGPSPGGARQLVGGCIGHEEWSSGRIAIDYATGRLWMIGHDQTAVGPAGAAVVHEYRLADCKGTGGDPSTWPVLQPVRTTNKFWQNVEGSGTYCGGLAFFRSKLWCSPKVMYAASAMQGGGPLTLVSPDGDRIDVPLPRQKFSGFVKRAGQEPLIGGGGYASGQGSVSGPTLATMDGKVLLSYEWPATPGAKLENWKLRAPRDPNYWVIGHGDSWVGWEPRTINGIREGRWASDDIDGGGLLLPDGLKYWPIMGIGQLDYANQSLGFAAEGNVRTYEYTYDPNTYQFVSYKPAAMGWVKGQEVAPDGTVYLAQRWLRGNYIAITIWR